MSRPLRARVVLVAGPSGAGKSRLAARSGLPVVHLDDFYKDGSDPTCPRDPELGIVDWDDPRSWDAEAAVHALERLCRTGSAELPVYDLARDGRVGSRRLDLGDSRLVLAEGIFAAEVAGACRDRGLLADAVCVHHSRPVTFWRRLVRDLRERRKPAPVLVRRGLGLLRTERAHVERLVALGCRPVRPRAAAARIRELRARAG